MSMEGIRELQGKLNSGFKDKFPCSPEFITWTSESVDLARVNALELAHEINRFLVEEGRQGRYQRADVPFKFRSKVAGGEILVTLPSKPIRQLQQEIERLARERGKPPFRPLGRN